MGGQVAFTEESRKEVSSEILNEIDYVENLGVH